MNPIMEVLLMTYAFGTWLDIVNWYGFRKESRKNPKFYEKEANEIWRFLVRKIGYTPSILISNVFLGVFLLGAYFYAPQEIAIGYVFGLVSGILLFNSFHDLYLIGEWSKPKGEKK